MLSDFVIAWRSAWLMNKLSPARPDDQPGLSEGGAADHRLDSGIPSRLDVMLTSRYPVRQRLVRNFMRDYGEIPEDF